MSLIFCTTEIVINNQN